MAGMTRDHAQLFREAWQLFDTSGAEVISLDKFKQLLKAIGLSTQGKALDRVLKKVDPEGSGNIKYDSFMKFMSDEMVSPTASEIVNAFKVFDKNNSGFVAPAELRHLLAQLDDKLTDSEFNEVLKIAGVDRDGEINFEEFAKLLAEGE